jgi:uncharacterized protein YggU (UPF0235/DUF167 family)
LSCARSRERAPQRSCTTATSFVVAVRAKAVDGDANAAVVRAVAAWLDVPPSSVTIARGTSSRVKQLAIDGLSEQRLAAAVAGLRAVPRRPSTSSG